MKKNKRGLIFSYFFSSLGITLIALVVSIILILILVGVSISMLTGDNGILIKTATAKQATEESKELELIKLAVTAAQTAGEGTLSTENLNKELRSNFDDNNTTVEKIGSNWYYKGYCIEENGNTEKYDKLLPKEYQQVEYIKLDVDTPYTTYIDTNLKYSEISKIICRYGYENFKQNYSPMFLSAAVTNGLPWICTDGVVSNNGGLILENSIGKTINLEPTEFYVTVNSSSSNKLRIGGWSDIYWTPVGSYYYVKAYNKLNDMVFYGIPCYNKTSTEIGLFDIVEKQFYKNSGTGTFLKGEDV